MAIAPPVAAPTAPEAGSTALAPLLLLPQDLRLTPEQFALVCEANPDAVLELAADGQLITMTPSGGETGALNYNLGLALGLAARQCSLPLQLFDSSTGFRLADGSVLSPDASVVRLERWQALTLEQRRSFPPLCPDLVIELASASNEGPRGADALRRKMALYQANGAQLGWLLFPQQRAVEIWSARPEAGAAAASQRLENALRLDGGSVLPGLVLELEEIWAE
ncbi:MAG: Uma2 family endonuclease [Synechococcaceae cyanobacterium]